VTGFFTSHPSIAPENVDRMRAAYLRFVRTHFELDPLDPMSHGVGYVITSKMAELFEIKGDRL
jgi:hypothetical protein